jgi:hypothetical protein
MRPVTLASKVDAVHASELPLGFVEIATMRLAEKMLRPSARNPIRQLGAPMAFEAAWFGGRT